MARPAMTQTPPLDAPYCCRAYRNQLSKSRGEIGSSILLLPTHCSAPTYLFVIAYFQFSGGQAHGYYLRIAQRKIFSAFETC
jgi:hypothetical protein